MGMSTKRIERLTKEINTLQMIVPFTRISLEAKELGDKLIEIKSLLKHGQFLPWIRTNFQGRLSQAYKCMKVAKGWDNADLKNPRGYLIVSDGPFLHEEWHGIKFWNTVNVGLPDECWLWKGALTSKGYGQWAKGARYGTVLAHRIAMMIHLDVQLPTRIQVLHDCDNPPCCNPDHLFLGTHFDNMIDCIEKGRHYCCRFKNV